MSSGGDSLALADFEPIFDATFFKELARVLLLL